MKIDGAGLVVGYKNGHDFESGDERGWIFSEMVRALRAKAWMWWTRGEAVRVLRMLEP
jgi:hypothetical protein